jgi:hypothetical protein
MSVAETTFLDATRAEHLSAAAETTPERVSTWAPVPLADYLDGTAELLQPFAGRRRDGVALIYPGRTHLFAGESESGKSWAALSVAAERLAEGESVVYCDFEDHASTLAPRLLDIGVPRDLVLDGFHYVRPDHRLDPAAKSVLEPLLTSSSLAVIDGVTEAMASEGLDPASDVDVATFYNRVTRWMAGHGPAVILVDHVVKAAAARGRWATGSQHKISGLTGAAYTFERVHPMGRGLRGVARVLVGKDRGGQVRRHARRLTGEDRWQIADFVVDASAGPLDVYLDEPPDLSDFRPTHVMERVSDVLAAASTPLSKNQIEQAVDAKATVTRQALALLVTEGHVAQEPGARGAQLHRLLRAYPPAEDAREEGGW